jgi:hypothetical protein
LYGGVPKINPTSVPSAAFVSCAALEAIALFTRPKSSTFTLPLPVTLIVAGFRSR